MSEPFRPIDEVIALHDFRSPKPNLLGLSEGDTVYVLGKADSGWWDGVVFGEQGAVRGWFPSNYCKNRALLNTEHSTAAAATNNPIPMNRVHQQSLLRQSFPRKGSGVSMSSDDRQHSPRIEPDDGKILVVTATEAENIFNSTGSNIVPIWIPQATTHGTIIYYNSELDIYCKELPYIETPEVDETSVIRVPTKEEDPKALSLVNLQRTHLDQGSIRNRQSTTGTTGTYTPTADRRDSSKGSIVSYSSLPSTATVHPWNSSLYCVPELFYYDPSDITTWPALRDAFLYFLHLTLDAVQRKSPTFSAYYNIASRLGTLIHLAARLAQHDLQKSGYQMRVQRRLKKIATSIAQVGINGNLYLTETPASSDDSSDSSASNSINYLEQVETEIANLRKSAIACIKVFMQISSNNFNDQCLLPQVYPRFLTGFFSGGNWRNPFVPEPKDPFAGKEVVKSLHQKRLHKTLLSKETYDELEAKKTNLTAILEDVLNMLKQPNVSARNIEILSNVHKSIAMFSKVIDTVEGFDFSVFLKPRCQSTTTETGDMDPSKMVYPLLSEFFESKQEVRDIFVSIIMEAQNLTLPDATVFKSMREDQMESQNKFTGIEPEKSAKALEAELNKLDVDFDDGISVDADKNLEVEILKSFEALDLSLALIGQLVSEKEAYLNYTTRLLNDDITFELIPAGRDDSTHTTDEYALPASATGRHDLRDLPWYLQTEEFNLIFSNNDNVKGGTREALVQRLTHHDLLDASFNMTFLTTFRSMVTTTELVEMLIKRFKIDPPANLSYEEYSDWLGKKSYPIKLRVVNIMKSLLGKYWTNAYLEHSLLVTWGTFIDGLLAESFPGSEQLARQFKKNVVDADLLPVKKQDASKKSISVKSKRTKVLDIEPTELANQLAIRESRLYNQITEIECLDKCWNKKYGSLGGYQHLQEFISNSNDLTNFVATTIISQTDTKRRVVVVKYFVDVAEKCRELNNFSSMTAIISALYSSPVHRLSKTWDLVPEATQNKKNNLNDLMNSSRNFSEYREHLRFISDQPCVPFLGVFLSDLTFTTNGNPDYLHGDPKLVNFSKRAKTMAILREMSRYQHLKYNIRVNEETQGAIMYWLSDVKSIDELYNRSLVIEPRVRVSKKMHNDGKMKKRVLNVKQHKTSIAPFMASGI